jgi:hypothetical protein
MTITNDQALAGRVITKDHALAGSFGGSFSSMRGKYDNHLPPKKENMTHAPVSSVKVQGLKKHGCVYICTYVHVYT